MLKHYVHYDTPGFFFAEGETEEVATRIPAQLKKVPQGAFRLQFFSREEIVSQNVLCEQDIEFKANELGMKVVCETCKSKFKCITEQGKHIIRGKEKNHSVHIVFGDRYTVAELKAKNDPELRILISNVEGNGYEYGVYCITKNWTWAEKTDIVLINHAELKKLTEAI